MEITDFSVDYFSLKGKNAIVTGGNTGLGQAFSLALAKGGADIFMPSIMPDDPAFNRLIEAEGSKARWMEADIIQPGIPKKMVDTCVNEWGTLTSS
jgi:NAD(P)-dependent dehydrogenase (short-subunit alcohol dehydrogenase family)